MDKSVQHSFPIDMQEVDPMKNHSTRSSSHAIYSGANKDSGELPTMFRDDFNDIYEDHMFDNEIAEFQPQKDFIETFVI